MVGKVCKFVCQKILWVGILDPTRADPIENTVLRQGTYLLLKVELATLPKSGHHLGYVPSRTTTHSSSNALPIWPPSDLHSLCFQYILPSTQGQGL